MRIFGDSRSGNCYKLQLLLSHIGQSVDWAEVDVLSGYTRTPEFLEINPAGQIPVLVRDDGSTLSQSNAILYYLAENSAFIPTNRWEHAKMLEWQNFEQYSHEPTIAVARFIQSFLGLPENLRAEYEAKRKAGARALGVMQQYLATHQFFGGEKMTLADISLYAYTHVADEGGFDLNLYPAIQRWLTDIAAQSSHVPMQLSVKEGR